MKHKLLLFLLLLPQFLLAQSGHTLRGSIIGSQSGEPIGGVVVRVLNQDLQTTSDLQGNFSLVGLAPGKYTIELNSILIQPKYLHVEIASIGDTETGTIKVQELSSTTTDLASVGQIDAELFDEDGGTSTQEVNTLVLISNDVFLKNASFQLSPLRFSPRGYDNTRQQRYINGVAFNDQNRGVFNYAAVGALNDMTRNGDATQYTQAGSFTFGGLGGAENINMRASAYTTGHKATLSLTNRNYYLRGMYTYSTGLNRRGWAFTTSIGGRYANEGYIDGTYYRNLALAFSAEKQWEGGKHSLSFVTLFSPTVRGQQGSTFKEVYTLTDNYRYNPNWGYYNGKKRNAREVYTFDPTAVLSHIWKITPQTTLTTGLGVHFARYGGSSLNWYKGADPRPDYYRYLPSYFEDGAIKDHLLVGWLSENTDYTQIDWNSLYTANLNNVKYGSGDAIYMIEERRSDLFETTFNSTVNSQLNRKLKLTAGIEARYSISDQFKTVKDLMGATHVLDIDKYAERDFAGDFDKMHNDLNRPHRLVYKDGIFGYHFKYHIYSASAWAVNNYSSRYWDFYYGFKVKHTSFYRDGQMRNGRYPETSYGKGKTHSFTDLSIKGGATYKFNGRHLISANFSYGSEAPLPNNAYVSPRITDGSVHDLKSARILSGDLSYIISLPSFVGRVGVFQTNFYDLMERNSYYDDTEKTFLNHVMYGINKIHRGIELGATYKIDGNWSVDVAGSAAQYYYSNNPGGVKSAENGKIADEHEMVYMRNVNVGGIPQLAGTIGLRYFINYWFLGAHLNGFGRNYISASPIRRLASTYATVEPNTPEYDAYKQLTTQEKLSSGCTLDLSIGKMFYLGSRSLSINVSVNNVLNRRGVFTGGFEQGRYDLTKPNKYASRYFVMPGINCFINASYRF